MYHWCFDNLVSTSWIISPVACCRVTICLITRDQHMWTKDSTKVQKPKKKYKNQSNGCRRISLQVIIIKIINRTKCIPKFNILFKFIEKLYSTSFEITYHILQWSGLLYSKRKLRMLSRFKVVFLQLSIYTHIVFSGYWSETTRKTCSRKEYKTQLRALLNRMLRFGYPSRKR